MKKNASILIVVAVSAILLSSCRSSKPSCAAYDQLEQVNNQKWLKYFELSDCSSLMQLDSFELFQESFFYYEDLALL